MKKIFGVLFALSIIVTAFLCAACTEEEPTVYNFDSISVTCSSSDIDIGAEAIEMIESSYAQLCEGSIAYFQDEKFYVEYPDVQAQSYSYTEVDGRYELTQIEALEEMYAQLGQDIGVSAYVTIEDNTLNFLIDVSVSAYDVSFTYNFNFVYTIAE